MGEAIEYEGYVEVREDGTWLAHLLDLPGCSAVGMSDSEAANHVLARIPAYYGWLRRHDEYTPEVHGPFQVAPKEAVRVGAPGQVGGAFFAPDAAPVTNEDLDWYLALLAWAYTDLYEAAQANQQNPLGPEGQTPQSVIQHVSQGQLWLISRLEEQPNVPRIGQLPGTALEQLRQVWQASIARLRVASEVERERILEHDGERWSLRKVLRRSIQLTVQALDMFTHSPFHA